MLQIGVGHVCLGGGIPRLSQAEQGTLGESQVGTLGGARPFTAWLHMHKYVSQTLQIHACRLSAVDCP